MVDSLGSLILNPRLGAKKGSKQSKATDSITGNQAFAASGGATAGAAGTAIAGLGGTTNGSAGTATPGHNGSVFEIDEAIGGGLAVAGDAVGATVDFTSITLNRADTNFNDVVGSVKS